MVHDPVARWAAGAGGSGGRAHHQEDTADPRRPPTAAGAGRAEPVLITEAEPSLTEQHDARKRRYLITMGIRMASLIAAALTYQVSVWLMAVFAVLGTVLPWFAVVMANDRPPKKRVDP